MAVSLNHPDVFSKRHIGPDEDQQLAMLKTLGLGSLDELVDSTVPKSIRMGRPLEMPPVLSESQLLEKARELASKNRLVRSFIGTGYSDCVTPPVILRNILENPGWYTAYTPYQAEIAQGRLEALLNYQTMVGDLTGLPIANASLLDEGTAAAEAMTMLRHIHGKDGKTFFASEGCHPQTIDVVRTRAKPLGIEIAVGDHRTFDFAKTPVFGVLLQYPATDGPVHDYRAFIQKAHEAGALVAMAADLLALAVLVPPGELGADVALGSSQRFGVPLGYGGPHAAYFAAKQEHVRSLPGRIIGVSQDSHGNPALRMALGTREQHIRREKATSNICTAQVLLAVIAGSYAVYHGPKGIRAIAERMQALTGLLAEGLKRSGFKPAYDSWFDTVRVDTSPEEARRILAAADAKGLGFRRIGERAVGVSLDETHSVADVDDVLSCFREGLTADPSNAKTGSGTPKGLERTSAYLTHPVFNKHHSETEMLRYLRLLESRDLSLTHSMIPLGSCTMKLNATAEMMPVTMPGFGRLHPFAPRAQAEGYKVMFDELEMALAEITGFPGISLQPNAGSQGEYAGLLVIRKYQETRGQGHRSVCLIPESAHGTNPASAAMAGMKVVVVKCDDNGNIDIADLEAKAKLHAKDLCALMVTYPSTHGVFEEDIKKICSIVHEFGGQVYMDGANMNAQVGLTRPGDIGADVCHLNLHKTFCIPHGGGGPGMGPIGVAAHLSKFLPKHPVVAGVGGDDGIGAISAAPWGSASILLISWAYIRMMGGQGLTDATRVAILNANYIAKRLDPHFPVLYKGKQGFVAHECIVDLRPLKKTSGVEAEDVAKRLMDYGFHSPTLSFPVAGTLMIEPTESETKEELDRFCDAMIAIRNEIREVEEGKQPKEGNLLKNAPHTAAAVIADAWTRPYSRERAAFPAPWVRTRKFWPSVGRVNNAFGDRNLVCSCPPIDDYRDEPKRATG